MKSRFIHPKRTIMRGIDRLLHVMLAFISFALPFVIPFVALLPSVPAHADSTTPVLFFPMITQGYVAAPPDPCTLSNQEAALVEIIRNAPGQGRSSFTCNATLAAVAHSHAADMATRGFCSSTTPEGKGANYRARQAGYPLPTYYFTAVNANNVETVACGQAQASDVWDGQRTNEHLQGRGDFWSKQVEFGIAQVQAPGSQHGYYWVILTAERGQ